MKQLTLLTVLCLALSAHAAQTCKDGITATAPASYFTINADNTVTDKTTGLTWMRCSLGQTGNDCSGGSAKKYTWAGALNEVVNNHSGWRLPNIKELTSIVELKCAEPAINVTIFPNTQSDHEDYYWSSTPEVYSNISARTVDSSLGLVRSRFKGENGYVRLVRGGL